MDVLRELKMLGYEVILEGNNIKLTYTKAEDPPKDQIFPLMEKIRQNKSTIIEHLKSMQIAKEISLNSFEHADIAVKYYWPQIGEEFYLVSDKAMQEQVRWQGLVSFLPREMIHLIKIHPTQKELKMIYAIKRNFPGSEILN